MRKLIFTIAAVLLLALGSAPAHAQSLFDLEFDHGRIELFHPIHVTGNFRFTGLGVDLTGELLAGDGNVSPTCTPCVAGELTSVNGQLQSIGLGQAIFNGPLAGTVTPLWYLYFFNLQTPGVVLPYSRSQRPFTITLPASLSGNLSGYASFPGGSQNPPPVFNEPLSFQGTVRVTLVLQGSPLSPGSYSITGRPFYSVQSIVYDF